MAHFLISYHKHGGCGAPSSGYTQPTILTNRPEAVQLGAFGPEMQESHQARDARGWYSYRRFAEVGVDETLLGEGDFVAISEYTHFESCGTYNHTRVKHVAGREVGETDFSFGTAYAEWAEAHEHEALEHLREFAANKPRKVQHSLEFAAGAAHPCSPFEQRRKAWRAVLRAFGVRGDLSKVVASVRTATVKTALRLGWQPSVPAPKFWQGLPSGVVELTPDRSEKGHQWVSEQELADLLVQEWNPPEREAA